jgi:lipopolysaccharide transport system ATP-binding protein
VRGRAGALIEISAGFHPDLTGRENVFLQGAIMGMPQRLIRQQFDEIIEFSGIAPFIDTPVKRYSSGMNARLGFAIAVHLEPEALIIDEVLSVGDAEFQGRAFDKIRSLVRSGIPVVIVSHQLDRIVELCSECILLRQGQVAFKGSAAAAVHEYLHNSAGRAATVEDAISAGIGFLELRLPESGQVVSGASLAFSVVGEVTAAESPKDVELEIVVVDAATNTRVYCNDLRNLGVHPTRKGPFQLECTLQAVFPPGLYRVETVVWHATRAVIVGQGPTRLFQVTDGMPFRGTHQVSMAVRLSPPTRA